jgi:hypothetical protein
MILGLNDHNCNMCLIREYSSQMVDCPRITKSVLSTILILPSAQSLSLLLLSKGSRFMICLTTGSDKSDFWNRSERRPSGFGLGSYIKSIPQWWAQWLIPSSDSSGSGRNRFTVSFLPARTKVHLESSLTCREGTHGGRAWSPVEG